MEERQPGRERRAKPSSLPDDHCPECGAPYEFQRKWNGGNPVMVGYPTCDCLERRTEAYVDRLIDGINRRRAEGQ